MKNAEKTFKKEYPDVWDTILKAGLSVMRHDRCYWLTGCGAMRQLDGYQLDDDGSFITNDRRKTLVAEKVQEIIDARSKLLNTNLNDRFENLVALARKNEIRRGHFTTIQEQGGDKVVLSEFVKCYADFSLVGVSGSIKGEGQTKDQAINDAIKQWNERK